MLQPLWSAISPRTCAPIFAHTAQRRLRRLPAWIAALWLAALLAPLPALAAGIDDPSVHINFVERTEITNKITSVAEDVILQHLWEITGKATVRTADGVEHSWETERVTPDADFDTGRAAVQGDLETWSSSFPGHTEFYSVNQGETGERLDFASQSYEDVQTDSKTEVTRTITATRASDGQPAVEGIDYVGGDAPDDPTQWIAIVDVNVEVEELTTITNFIDRITTTNYNRVGLWEITARRVIGEEPITLFTVTASAGAGGSASPATQQVADGTSATITLTPDFGYEVSGVTGTCPAGTETGNSYVTGAITEDCTVQASFAAVSGPIRHFEGFSTTGSGTVVADLSGGGKSCGFDGTPALVTTTSVSATLPEGISAFPHGLFQFRTADCDVGGTITMTLQFPSALPASVQYYKWGPEPGNATPHWYVLPATFSADRKTVTFHITDGNLGDGDLEANGAIVDPSGPGVPAAGPVGKVASIPTLGEWALLLLGLLLGGLGMRRLGAGRVQA